MGMFFGIIGFLGIAISIVALIVKAIMRKSKKGAEIVNIPATFEPPVRILRATVPDFQSHPSGVSEHTFRSNRAMLPEA